ncbi:uncharacterized protein LOC128345702 isoform X3 [Hemicordylus capensis]|uniref:uncharacterized protein LOC128345702 isoform X3 n=1 Tax=Hemicordylus capensis TaxID=884348 RepID=UPI002304702A|nr:uncharacterized protein LOC128345702 isoform X3 [Hemicordylus capensis]
MPRTGQGRHERQDPAAMLGPGEGEVAAAYARRRVRERRRRSRGHGQRWRWPRQGNWRRECGGPPYWRGGESYYRIQSHHVGRELQKSRQEEESGQSHLPSDQVTDPHMKLSPHMKPRVCY